MCACTFSIVLIHLIYELENLDHELRDMALTVILSQDKDLTRTPVDYEDL